ncbi:MAG: TM2 domain-containing protein [Lachnospiraceae bacterium]|nr:TM2 domain-containing protein [Lachnospiraceae bacterium]
MKKENLFCEEKSQSCPVISDPGKCYDQNGIRYEKHAVHGGLLGIFSGEEWYPVAEDDPDSFFLLALFGGLFGLHKFKTGQITAGILYLISFGGLGVLYIMDLISMLLGTYCLKQTAYTEDEQGQLLKHARRIYIGKPGRILCKLVYTSIALVLTYFAVRYGYIRYTGRAYARLTQSAYERIMELSESAGDSMNDTLLQLDDTHHSIEPESGSY